MAFFKCSGGINPTGNATAGDVKSGKTFSNADGTDLVGTFAAQEKTITSSRSAQTVTPDSGKYLSKVTVNALAPTGTYKPTARANNNDMGATSNYRYVDTTAVPNTNSGTYTYAANSTGGTVDMGATNTYRYVNAANVYTKGKADGKLDLSGSLLSYESTSALDSLDNTKSYKFTSAYNYVVIVCGCVYRNNGGTLNTFTFTAPANATLVASKTVNTTDYPTSKFTIAIYKNVAANTTASLRVVSGDNKYTMYMYVAGLK